MEPETTSFGFGFCCAGLTTLALLAAVDELNAAGWTIEPLEVSSAELMVQGVTNEQFGFASGGFGALLAAQQGAPISIVMTRARNEWVLYARSDIAECADLDGVRVGATSEGSPPMLMLRGWIEKECPGTEPQLVVIPGSNVRVTGILVGELDATPLELQDAALVRDEAGDEVHILVSFAEELPELEPTPIYTNSEWAAENPNTVALFLKAVLEQHRKLNSDAAYFEEMAIKYLGDQIDQETLAESVQIYIDQAIYPDDGGMDPEVQQFTIDFATEAGEIESGLTPDDVFDRSYLDHALELIGS